MPRKARPSKTAGKVRRNPRAVAAPTGVLVVNMIPRSLSAETNQDSEPMLAVDPTNVNNIVGTAFTPDPLGGPRAPIFISSDGGRSWTLNSTLAGGRMTSDVTVAFSGRANRLFAGILRQDSPVQNQTRMSILRADNFSDPAPMEVIDDRQQPDQPFTQALTQVSADGTAIERLFVGNNDFAAKPMSATVDVSADAQTATPTFTRVRIESRSTSNAGQDGPQVRPIAHPDGTVYAAYYAWRSITGSFQANTLKVTSDVVVVRDDAFASEPAPFTALEDAGDGMAGVRVVQGVSFAFNRTGLPANGQQRLGGTLSIAVDPRNSSTIYLAWGDDEPTSGFTIHVRRSTDKGQTWTTGDLLTVASATNAALAINSEGLVGLLFQQLTGTGAARRWETHFRCTPDGASWSDLVLANTPANSPPATFSPYLGDYDHVLAVGKDFYGIFSANNTADMANFPNGVIYQRNADFATHRLLAIDNTTTIPMSIDPFFFKING